MMNNHRAPGGTPHDPAHHPAELSELREIRETVLQASHAQQRMTRTVLEALDRLEHRYGPPPIPAPADADPRPPRPRPEHWPTTGHPQQPQSPVPPAPPARPRRSERDRVTLAVSILGAVITVIGLVFLAVQAFSRGWLGPASAVSGATALCVLLIGASFVMHRRSPAGHTAPALLTAGILGLHTDIWVMVFGLDWLGSAPGVAVGALVSVGGIGVAWAWRRQALAATLIVAGAAVITPTVLHVLDVSDSAPFESASLLVLALVGIAGTWRRNWNVAAVCAGASFAVAAILLAGDGNLALLTAGAAAGITVSAWLTFSPPPQNTGTAGLARWIPVSVVPVLLLLGSGEKHWNDWAVTVAALAIAAGTAALPALWSVGSGTSLRPAAVAAAPGSPVDSLRAAVYCGTAGVVLVFMVRQDDPYSTGALWWMLGLVALAAGVVLIGDRLPVPLVWSVSGVAALYCLPRLVPAWLLDYDVSPLAMWPPLVAVAVPGGLLLWRANGLGATPQVTTALRAGLLIVVTSAIPLVCLSISGSGTGFMVGHLVMSVLWMGLGVAALLRGTGMVGLGIAGLASAKLVFYDLSALSGLIQVAAFVICGVILLASAVLRDRTPAGQGPGQDD
ncbi:MAG: hypothetical protein ACTH1D_12765 [Mycobacteriaceae bacterium]|uniref:hypothetical protein n=1 Tax=Corynebacterium sp. TaxID=1720 RepID=UPI003F9CE1A2